MCLTRTLCSFYLSFQSVWGSRGYSLWRHSDADLFCNQDGKYFSFIYPVLSILLWSSVSCITITELTFVALLLFLQRDSSDNIEASVVLSGMFMQRHIVSRSLYVVLKQMWLKESFFSLGVMDFLAKPVVAFVRLSDSVVLESSLECPVPVRFVFVLVGPSQSDIDYSECGRAMGALMADWVREKRNAASWSHDLSNLLCLVQVNESSLCFCSDRCSVWKPSWPRLTKIWPTPSLTSWTAALWSLPLRSKIRKCLSQSSISRRRSCVTDSVPPTPVLPLATGSKVSILCGTYRAQQLKYYLIFHLSTAKLHIENYFSLWAR